MAEQKKFEQAAQPQQQGQPNQPQQEQPQQQPGTSPAGAEAGGPPTSPAGAPGRQRDTRRVLTGVQLYESGALAGTIRTYTDSEEDKDALEEAMTKEQYERLKKLGALEGDWSPRGTPPPPMRGSELHRRQTERGGGGSEELDRLRKENEEMRAAALATVQRHREEADAHRAKAQLWDRQEAERQRLAQAERAANEPRGKGK